MQKFPPILLFLFSLLFSISALTVSALNISQIFTSNNGVSFTGSLKGDEYLNWIEDNNGNIIKYNKKTKNYEYAIIKNNNLTPSGVKVFKNINFNQGFNNIKVNKIPVINKNNLGQIWQNNKAKFFNR